MTSVCEFDEKILSKNSRSCCKGDLPFTAPNWDKDNLFVTKLMILLKIILSNTLPMLLRMEIGL